MSALCRKVWLLSNQKEDNERVLCMVLVSSLDIVGIMSDISVICQEDSRRQENTFIAVWQSISNHSKQRPTC